MLKKWLSVALVAVLIAGVLVVLLSQPSEAVEIQEMNISEEMIELLKEMEGFAAIPHWDYSQWTVGFGSTCPDEHLDRYRAEGIPPDEADALLHEQMKSYVADVNAFMVRNEVQLTQNQFDAMVSFVYNVGTSVLRNKESTIVKAILCGASGNDFIFAISQWNAAGGEFLPGLMNRRMKEAYVYLYGIYSNTLPETYCYIRYDANGGVADSRAQGYDINMIAVPMSVPTREGYVFKGWYTAAIGGTKVTMLDETHAGLTLYAQWEEGSISTGTPVVPETGITVTVTDHGVSVWQGVNGNYTTVHRAFFGEQITITGLAVYENSLWGYYEHGWICLDQTNYYELTGTARPGNVKEEESVHVPIKATVLSSAGVTVYRGPNTGYPMVGTLQTGETVTILEVTTFVNALWGRYEGGWIRLNQRLLLHDEAALAHSFVATVTYYYINIRNGPGSNYSYVDMLSTGDQVEIFAVVMVDGVAWGRCATGWIHLDKYTDYNSELLEGYKNHQFDQWIVSEEPTCAKPGHSRRNCTVCDHYEVQQIPAKEHVFGEWYVSETGNCAGEGQERRDCQNCDHYETRESALGGHSLGEWYVIREATCQVEGQQRRDCLYCDHYEIKQTELGSHSFGQWEVKQEATCDIAGQEQRLCATCGNTEERPIEAKGHSFGQWYESIAPTAEKEGESRRDCTVCDHYETVVLPVNPHVFGEWYVHQAPTCTEVGEERRNCIECEYYESREIAATGHQMGQWTPSREGTCVTVGQERRDCEACDYYELQDTVLGGHSYGQWVETVQGTCVTLGQESQTCVHCGDVQSRPTQLGGHSMGQWYVFQAASCTAEGQERRDCVYCDHFENRSLSMLAHSYGKWYTVKEPTMDQQGQQARDCLACGDQQIQSLPVLPSVEKVYATITTNSLNVRASASSSAAKVGIVYKGLVLEILEQKTVGSAVWGRIEWGWIRMTDYATLQTRRELVEEDNGEKTYATVETDYLSVRTKASSSSERVAQIWTGVRVRIYEMVTIGDITWGRTEIGWIWMSGYTTVEVVPGVHSEHSYGEWYVSEIGNCVTPGQERRDCTGCDHYEVRERQLGTHVMGDWYVTQQATCQVGGQERQDCQFCDYHEFRDTAVSQTHDFGEWYVTDAPGCTTKGKQVRQCAHCHAVETQELPAIGSHNFGQWYMTVVPGCTEAGEQCRDCTRCDYSECEAVAPTGHHFGGWYLVTSATETQPGEERRDCTACGYSESRAIEKTKVFGTFHGTSYLNIRSGAGTGYRAVGKLYPNIRVEILEQVEVDGKVWGRIAEGWICITGYIELEVQSGIHENHSFGNWYVSEAPTCEEAGLERRDCVACSHYETREAAPTGHQFSQWKIVAAPGCEQTGVEKRTCHNCGLSERQIVAAVGHNYGQWYVVKEATAEEPGQMRRDCEGCGRSETRETYANTVKKLYATITAERVTIREGAGGSYKRVSYLYQGAVVEILELTVVGERQWGRTADGWIRLTGDSYLTTVEEQAQGQSIRIYATVIKSGLVIRDGAGADAEKLGMMDVGTVIEVYEIVVVDGLEWGNTEQGWIRLTYYTTLSNG